MQRPNQVIISILVTFWLETDDYINCGRRWCTFIYSLVRNWEKNGELSLNQADLNLFKLLFVKAKVFSLSKPFFLSNQSYFDGNIIHVLFHTGRSCVVHHLLSSYINHICVKIITKCHHNNDLKVPEMKFALTVLWLDELLWTCFKWRYYALFTKPHSKNRLHSCTENVFKRFFIVCVLLVPHDFSFFFLCNIADNSPRHPCSDSPSAHPRRCGSHAVLQVQAVLQRCSWEICLHWWVRTFSSRLSLSFAIFYSTLSPFRHWGAALKSLS